MQWDERFLNELRALLPEYMAQKRIVVGTRGKKLIHCINPEHRDRTPSMSYHPQSRRLHCFGCGANYDLFDVIAIVSRARSKRRASCFASRCRTMRPRQSTACAPSGAPPRSRRA